ncbi:MAG: circularly permuted type 2 ATP-grasp protein [Acidobacteria bacterium]|nr:circularly permuted type 2 ATP-grasp protein [Acidobacteriota bacterium]
MADPLQTWMALLGEGGELSQGWWEAHAERMHDARLVFGGRLSCPFLRPLFMDAADEARQRIACESIARIGERIIGDAMADEALLAEFGLTDAERALVAIDPGYAYASTASRLDSFLLPDSLMFAEYNAESPAGLGYTEVLAEVFADLPIMARFREHFAAEPYALMDALLAALFASYKDWGGSASPPRILITDFRGVPTWSEFEILADHFTRRGIPTVVADPRDLEIAGGRLVAQGQPIDIVYRRALVNDIVARPDDTRVLMQAYRDGLVCMANTLRCKIPHKKSFFAVLTDETHAARFSTEEQGVIRAHVPWTRVVAERRTRTSDGRDVDLVAFARDGRDRLVLKPTDDFGGHGVMLGWETDASAWERALQTALTAPPGTWIVQERIPIRREPFPIVESNPHRVTTRDMLVDCAPYIFRGKVAGFLTRLSASGLANVTSGGGQVPVFRVAERRRDRA